MNIKKDNKGFTLMEIVVVSAIFVMTLVSLVAIFVNTNKAQKRVANSEKLQADTRYVVEVMAREIRNNRIDYSDYTTIELASQPLNRISLLDNNGNAIRFKFTNNKIQLYKPAIGGDTWYDITPDDILVTQLKFYLLPNSNSYVIDGPNQQPIVNISLSSQSLTKDFDDPKWTRIQTTISSRYYVR